MKSKILQWLAIVLILETGLLHFITAQGWFVEAEYVGYLFMANFMAALVAAYGMYRQRGWGWLLGFLVAAGSMGGYIWSRTLGLPGTVVENWFTPYGVVALVVEGLFILLLALRPWKMASPDAAPAFPAWLRDLAPSLGLVVIAAAGFGAYRWDAVAAVNIVDGHFHPGSVGELCRTPLTSFAQLEQQYGVKIAQVTITALDSIVDVRMKIIDPEKAYALIAYNHSALLVDQKALILPPHMHHHNMLKPGEIYFMFFPTQRNTVHTGSQVSLIFGSMRVEPITVK